MAVLTMIYMTPSASPIKEQFVANHWGQIITPRSGTKAPHRPIWCADNEAFTGCFSWPVFSAWLENMTEYRSSCVFVATPDATKNAVATLEEFRWYAWRIKSLGYPVALVAQDGIESLRWPPEYDALFIGGSTAWKLSDAADWCIRRARGDGKWVHVGRVNSNRRIRHFQLVGVDSVDGTSLTYAPDRHYRRFNRQLAQPALLGDI